MSFFSHCYPAQDRMLETELQTEYNLLSQFFLETQHLAQSLERDADMDGHIPS